MKRRRFLSGSPNHVYQRSLNGSVIFYSLEDCLVYFTVFCTSAVKYGVSVLGLCVMYDHIHQLLEAPDLRTLSTFERMVNLKFSMSILKICVRKFMILSWMDNNVRLGALRPYRTVDICFALLSEVLRKLEARLSEHA